MDGADCVVCGGQEVGKDRPFKTRKIKRKKDEKIGKETIAKKVENNSLNKEPQEVFLKMKCLSTKIKYLKFSCASPE